MPRRELESSLESFFRRRVIESGGATIKMIPTTPGIPDRLVILPRNRFYLVELKAEGGAVSPVQRALHDRLYRAQGVRVVVLTGRQEINDWLRVVRSE
jgi:hypothetical protein